MLMVSTRMQPAEQSACPAIGVPAFTTDARLVGAGFFVAGVAVVANLAGLLGAVTAGAVGEVIGLPAVFGIGAAVVVVSVLGRLVVTESRMAAEG
jgi:hypothetical protein